MSNTVTSSLEKGPRPHQKQNVTLTTPAGAGAFWKGETGKTLEELEKEPFKKRKRTSPK